MPYKCFIGCDVSKEKLDFAVWINNQWQLCQTIENNPESIQWFFQQLTKLQGVSIQSMLLCMEHTGIYVAHLLDVFHHNGCFISIVSARQIKQSLGLQRGKNDQVDAKRIAEYAHRFTDKLKLWKPKRWVIQQLQHLTSLRSRLVKSRQQLNHVLLETKSFVQIEIYEMTAKHCQRSIEALSKDLEAVEQKIKTLLEDDSHLKTLTKLIRSVPGVGPVIAAELIIRTGEFKEFQNAKQLACHCGVAPFEHSSGSSIKGKSRVSHKAHKNLKTLLHMGAMATITKPGELQNYYHKKLKQGKNKMSVINAIRNKIIHRVFAGVKNQVMYQENYHLCLQLS